jgi:hypothetical protein
MHRFDQYHLQLSATSSSADFSMSDAAGITQCPLLARSFPGAANTRQFKVKMFKLPQ